MKRVEDFINYSLIFTHQEALTIALLCLLDRFNCFFIFITIYLIRFYNSMLKLAIYLIHKREFLL